jgi:hypothetical protein
VIQLSPEDAAQAKRLADEQKALDSRSGDFHDHIMRTYLVTTDQNASSRHVWEDPADANHEFDTYAFTGSATINTANVLVGYEERCDTPAEKAARKAADKKAEQEIEAYRKAHPVKYLRDGWANPGYFEFSDNFEFIVPATPVLTYTTPQSQPFGWVKATSN